MPNPARATIHPDAAEALSPEFRIQGELAVRAVLRDLMARNALVTIYPDGRCDDALVTRITHVDEGGVEFDVSGQPECVVALAKARVAIGVAFPERVKTQFVLDAFRLLGAEHVPARSSLQAPAAPATVTLRAAVPNELHRIQRRDAFRVQPPAEDAACCVRRLGHDDEVRYEVLDLSAGGLSVRLAPGALPPAVGSIWRRSRIEAAGDRIIPSELLVRRVFEDPVGSGTYRVAFAFHAPPSEVLRQIQIYVLDIEKRLMRRR